MAGGRFGGGAGTAFNPYLIEDADDLNAMRKDILSFYKLVNNINLGVAPYNTGSGWYPIQGNFAGGLDGNGKAIMNLYINRPSTDYVGLFSTFSASNSSANVASGANYETFRDITFINPNVIGRDNTGVVAGAVTLGSIANAGGSKLFERIVIKNGNVTGRDNVGGIVGNFTGTSSSSYSFNIWDCKIECNITASPSSVSTNFGAGILAGRVTDTSNNYSSITRNICSGIVTCTNANSAYVKADIGYTAVISVSNSFYNSTISTKTGSFTAKTDTELKAASTYATAFTTTLISRHSDSSISGVKLAWSINNGRYPQLYSEVQNKLFILKNGTDYQTWNGSAWVTKYTSRPTRAQFVADGMSNFDAVTSTGWDALKSYTSAEIISFVDESKGINLTSSTVSLDSDTVGATRNIFKKSFNFSNLGTGINAIKNL